MAVHKKQLLEAFKPVFKDRGFRKIDATWVRETAEVFCVFNIQTSQWSELYYFNAGIYVKAVAPIERPTSADCHLFTRLPHGDEATQLYARLANFENQHEAIAERIDGLQRLIAPAAFEWFSKHDTVSKVRQELASHPKSVLPTTVSLLRYLDTALPA